MAVELKDAEKLKIKPNPIQDLTIGQAPEPDPLATEKIKIQNAAQETVRGNAARGEDLRIGLEKRLQTSDGRWYRFNKVGQTHAEGKPPELEPIELDDRGKIVDKKAAKQLPTEALKKYINSGIEWPSWVPKDARNEAAYNKYIRTRYSRATGPTRQVGIEEQWDAQKGHAQADIGMNTIIGAQPAKGERGNLSTKQEHYVVKGDTIESIAKQHGVRVKDIKKNNSGEVKKGIVTPGEQLYIRSVRTNLEDSRKGVDLEGIDMGTSKTGQLGKEINQFKAFEEYVFSFAPEEIKSKVLTTTVDTHSMREMGDILHGDTSPTAEAARFRMDLDRLQAEQTGLEARAQSGATEFPTEQDKQQAAILNKNPNLPDTRVKVTKGPIQYFDKIKGFLTNKNTLRLAAKAAGQSHNPAANIAGDFVGVVFDGIAYAGNPKDSQALGELIMSGTQLAASTVGTALIAIPDPLTGGLGYIIMKAGDRVGQVERLYNMSREGIELSKPGGIERMKARFTNQSPPEVVSRQSGQEVSELRREFKEDKRVNRNLSSKKWWQKLNRPNADSIKIRGFN